MVTWKEFAAAAPALARAGGALINQFQVGLAFLATCGRMVPRGCIRCARCSRTTVSSS
jgi:hypothetical protein